MWGRVASLILTFTLGLLAFPPWGPAQERPGAVYGIITSPSRLPVEGATVVLEGVGSTATDSQGRFVFQNVAPGNYILSVPKAGFSTASQRVLVRAGMAECILSSLGGIADSPIVRGQVLVPLIPHDNWYVVRALLNGRRAAYFVLDTEACTTVTTVISTVLAREAGVYLAPGSPLGTFVTAKGPIRAPEGTLASLRVGDVEAKDVAVAVHDQLYPSPEIGLLGQTFLSRFRLQVDAYRRVLVFDR